MKRRIFAFALGLCLLAGCGAPAAETVKPTETPEVTETTEVVPTPEPKPESPFGPLPVTEEGIRDYYRREGYYDVRGITPYKGDYLVELGHGSSGMTLLMWIFGASGRQVQMTIMDNREEVEIQNRGVLHIRTDGVDPGTGWHGLPRIYTAIAPAVGGYVTEVEETTWLDPREGFYIGTGYDGGEDYLGRYEQLCDARITADGLSFSFIPNTDSMEKFQSFFPACTTIPGTETTYEESTGVFTLRLHNTSLKSGEYAKDMSAWAGVETGYEGLYPRSIPEGSLGADNLFLENVEIRQEGEDAVITARLTERAGWVTAEYGNLGYDNIPWLTLKFREPDSMEVTYG